MSQGLPLAMGAQIALDNQVFAFEGDGGFAMVMQDLETAVRESKIGRASCRERV